MTWSDLNSLLRTLDGIEDRFVTYYAEEDFARAVRWHGPLPSEVRWFARAKSKPETLVELEELYASDPDEWVYRCYHGAELVYVGITRQGMNRVRQHIEHHRWMRLVTCIEVEHRASRQDAERREAELIRRFAPRFNRSDGHTSLLTADPGVEVSAVSPS